LPASTRPPRPRPSRPRAYRQSLAARIEDNLRELASPEFGLPRDELERLARHQRDFLHRHAEWFDARVRQGRIVEGHGDLRPEHGVPAGGTGRDPTASSSTANFASSTRPTNWAYLALECERLHAPQAGRWLLEAYVEASGDAVPAALIHFYQSCRAVLRAKLAVWHLRDDGRHPPGKWVATAMEYLQLAQRHAESAES